MPQKRLTPQGKRGSNAVHNAARNLSIAAGVRKWNAVTTGRINPSDKNALDRLIRRLNTPNATDDERDVIAIARLLIRRICDQALKRHEEDRTYDATVKSASATYHRAIKAREARAARPQGAAGRQYRMGKLQAPGADAPALRPPKGHWDKIFREFAIFVLSEKPPGVNTSNDSDVARYVLAEINHAQRLAPRLPLDFGLAQHQRLSEAAQANRGHKAPTRTQWIEDLQAVEDMDRAELDASRLSEEDKTDAQRGMVPLTARRFSLSKEDKTDAQRVRWLIGRLKTYDFRELPPGYTGSGNEERDVPAAVRRAVAEARRIVPLR